MPGTFKKTAPKTDIGRAMEYKEQTISKFQASKENSIHIASSGRDAALVVTAYSKNYDKLSEEELKKKIKEWRDWFYNNIYSIPF
jgi:hypothetical protein